ncbi:aldehyde:ferredoxin oxidoreductase [miscellaneous Crenarchaeota group-15 archaeon DG-45]|uniref:Aldehyde:ferredoxin oxidoreductase n=1 Tax=miscellaneous Crenarchaeota group-15 archaeon DG-45 TaxID=1685127 RepID=A0A0M0BML1_9ARCH|nr:MAG: aldehyde:ferredoxin oxidoreductase [miscellaneous Crenarchaeota group-15 archaeon DG-45]
MSGGYVGKFLRIDLGSGRIKDEKIPEETLRNFIGGRGLGVKILYDELRTGIDPLLPENKIVILTGPVTGTPAPESGRWCSVTKSPLTGTIHDSQSGGDFGPYLKFAGVDGVIFEGASEKPVFLWIEDGDAELRDASHLWGKDVFATTDGIIKGDKKTRVACIGPAGEKLVRFANIMNEKHRAAGRGGHGAVLGSKKVKAIAVRGDTRPPIADEDALKAVNKRVIEKIHEMSATGDSLPKHGTAVLVNSINEEGGYPTRNFQSGVFATAERTSGETLTDTLLMDKMGCWGCIIKCGRVSKVPPWSQYSGEGEGPEYETIWALGAQCGVDNLEAITKAHYLCNELGIDAIEMGNLIGLAMELYEKGYIEPELTRGLDLKFGTPQALIELTWRTAIRSGIGDDIAEGGVKFATKYRAPELFMGVRGQGLPAYDPRAFQGHGLGYATSNRGGCHLRAYLIAGEVVGEICGQEIELDPLQTEGKAQWVKTFQDLYSVCDSLILCKFNTFATGAEEFASTLSAVTGWRYTADDIMNVGEKIYNLERAFNVREGIHWEDEIPKRFLEDPLPDGPKKGQVFKLEEMLEEYYRLRGWKGGKPTKAKLKELGLDRASKEVGV